MKKVPDSLDRVLHYANADAREKTWKGIVFRPQDEHPGVSIPADEQTTPLGVKSLAAFEEIQSELRQFLARLIELEGAYSEDALVLGRELRERANPTSVQWTFSPSNDRLVEIWETGNRSFREMIYLELAMVLKEISFRELHRCEECEQFFFKASDRERKYCSNRCRSRVMVRQYRQRQAEIKPTGLSPRGQAGRRKAGNAPAKKRSGKKR